MKTAPEFQGTANYNPDRPGSKPPDANPKGGAWQFYFVIVAIGLGLLLLLGMALGLY